MTQRRRHPPFFPSPEAAQGWVNAALRTALTRPGDAWQVGALTYEAANAAPLSKTVVWRAWAPKTATLTCYTDIRSQKWTALAAKPQAALLLYCPVRAVQLCVQALARLSTGGEELLGLYETLSEAQRHAYQSRETPGQPLVSVANDPPCKTLDPGLGARYFGKIDLVFCDVDFLSLHPKGHQRLQSACFQDPASWRWLCP